MAEDRGQWELFGAACFYHRPTGTLYVVAEYLVDLLCLPRTATSCVEVTGKECQRFAEEYPEKPLSRACVMPFPGIMTVKATEGEGEEERWTTREQEEGPHGAA